MNLQRMDNLQLAGFVVGLVGALLALVPYLETMLTFQGEWWTAPLLMSMVAGLGLMGLWYAQRGRTVEGGIFTAVPGIVLAVLGPTAPGILMVVGGTLLFVSTLEAPSAQTTAPVEIH